MKTVWIMTSGAGEIVGVWGGEDLGDAMSFADRLFAGCRWEKRLSGDWEQITACGEITSRLHQYGVGCGDATVCRDRYGCDADGRPLPSVEVAAR